MPFTSPLIIELIDPLANDGQGEWELHAPLHYVTNAGVEHVAHAGFRTDLSSVPRLPFVYMRYGNTAHGPGALHDWLLKHSAISREAADAIFLEAMESIGMPNKRIGPMFRGVAGRTRQLAARNKPWGFDDYPG